MPPFTFNDFSYPALDENDFENRFFRNAVLLENGAIYIGEWLAIIFFDYLFLGQMKRKMAKEYRFGKMALFTKDFGRGTWLRVKVDYTMPMGIFTKE